MVISSTPKWSRHSSRQVNTGSGSSQCLRESYRMQDRNTAVTGSILHFLTFHSFSSLICHSLCRNNWSLRWSMKNGKSLRIVLDSILLPRLRLPLSYLLFAFLDLG